MEAKERTKDVIIEERISFNTLLLSDRTLSGLKKQGFQKPSPIQLKAIPLGRCGFDLIVKSKSGTGKTAVFSIIALEMINIKKIGLQVLIVAPTREIAVQVCDVITSIGSDYEGLKATCFIGGLSVDDDIANSQKCHIAVGTPGRLKHLIEAGHLKTKLVKLFVLDEADKLMESSYQSDINKIYHKLPPRKQMLALSATYPDELDTFLAKYMLTPTHISPSMDTPLLLGLRQYVTVVKCNLNVFQQMNIKIDEVIRLLEKISFTQCLVFSNLQSQAESVSNTLNRKGWATTYISAAQSQEERLAALSSLKEYKCRVLLSTDLTARGIDAPNVDLIINYDVPHDASTYLHRMGRAGRYGTKGICVSIASKGDELLQLQKILGVVGGTDLSIAKLPNDGFPDNLWEADQNAFEQISSIVSEEKITEEGMRFENIKKSIFQLKKGDKDNKSIKPSDDVEDLPNDVEDVEPKMDFDTESIIQKLADGQSIQSFLTDNIGKHEDTQGLQEVDTTSILKLLSGEDANSSSINKRKRVEQTNTSGRSSHEIVTHKEKRKTTPDPKSIYERNVSLLNITKLLLSNEISESVDTEVSSNIDTYLKKINLKDAENISAVAAELNEKSCDEILDNVDYFVNNLRPTVHPVDDCEGSSDNLNLDQNSLENLNHDDQNGSLENLFVYAYDYATKPNSRHWLDVIGMEFDETQEEPEVQPDENNLLLCQEEDDEDSEEMFQPRVRNRYRKKSWTKRKQISNAPESATFSTTKATEIDYPVGLYTNHEYGQCETFVNCFSSCSEELLKHSHEEDIHDFDTWFLQWQQQVQGVRDYVQQNVYLQEMNRYQYYKSQRF